MTPEVLTLFVEEILRDKDSYTTDNKALLLIVSHLDQQELKYHVELETHTLWRKKAWKIAYERSLKIKAASEKENQIIWKRKETLLQLRRGISSYMGLNIEDDNCFMVALKIMKHKDIKSAAVFGVDISDLPELEKPYTIISSRGSSYVL